MAHTRSDGIDLAWDDAGSGEPALLCLPGWCASRAAFEPFVAELRARRRVLALDWRGHGGSGAATGDFGAAEQLRDALAVIAASGASAIVPVATAHAGWIALELARALGPARVPKLVLVDWIVTAAPPPFLAGLGALQDRDRWQATRDRLFAMWTEGVSDARVKQFVTGDMGSFGFDMWARAGREISAAYAAHGSPLDALARLAPPPPTLHVYAQPSDPGFYAAQEQFAATHPWFHVQRLEARSHFPTLEVPGALAQAVESFVTRSTARAMLST